VSKQFEAALKISAISIFASYPGGVFSAVAFKLPKPIPKCGSRIILCPWTFASY